LEEQIAELKKQQADARKAMKSDHALAKLEQAYQANKKFQAVGIKVRDALKDLGVLRKGVTSIPSFREVEALYKTGSFGDKPVKVTAKLKSLLKSYLDTFV
jgi:hypothetical protein